MTDQGKRLTDRLDRAAQGATRFVADRLRQDPAGLAFALLVALAGGGSLLTDPVFSIDQEIFPAQDQQRWFLDMGRWTLWLVRLLTAPVGLVPYLSLLLGLILLGFAAWVLGRALLPWPDAGPERLAFCALFATSPVLAHLLVFTSPAPGCMAGLAACALGCALAEAGRYRLADRGRLAGCAALVALGVGAYQSLLLVLPVFAALRQLLLALRGAGEEPAPAWRQVAGFCFVACVLGLAGHLAVAALFKLALGLEQVSAYQWLLVGWNAAAPRAVFAELGVGLSALFAGHDPVPGALLRFFPWLTLTVAGLVCLRAGPGLAQGLCALALAAGLPFSLHLALGHALPVRSLFALALAGAGLFVALCLGRRPFARLVLLVLAALLTVNNVFNVDRLAESQRASLRRDAVLAAEIARTIRDARPPHERDRPVAVTFVGGFDPLPDTLHPTSETFGRSFFSWDGGRSHRIVSALRHLGYWWIVSPGPEQAEALAHIAATLPPWPAPDSVRVLPGGMAAVNLGQVR